MPYKQSRASCFRYFKIWNKRTGTEEDSTFLLVDFSAAHATVLEDWFLNEDTMERRLAAPSAIHGFANAATDQINYFGVAYGSRRREERIRAIRFLLGIRGYTPDPFTVEFIGCVWGQVNYDFFTKRQEGAKRLRQAVGKHADQVELRRLGRQLDSNGKARWFYPRTFEMTTEA